MTWKQGLIILTILGAAFVLLVFIAGCFPVIPAH